MRKEAEKKEIVIHGASGLKNSGDEAILEAIVRRCPAGWRLHVISFDKGYTEKLHPQVHAIQIGSRECREWIDRCDGFILGGGGLLQDETSVYNVGRWLKYLRHAQKKGKKTFLYANSIGPLRYGFHRRMVGKTLRRVELITVRDEISRQELARMGVKTNVLLTADPVFSLTLPQKDCNENPFGQSMPERYVVLCARHWFDTIAFLPVSICTRLGIRRKKDREKYRQYMDSLAQLVGEINREWHMPVVFLPFLYGRDDKVAEDILRKAGNAENRIVSGENMRPEDMMNLIGHAEMLIGMRLHSIIYGIIAGTPMIALDYSQKVRGMLQYVGLEPYSIDVDNLNGSGLIQLFRRAWEDREKQTAVIRAGLLKLRLQEEGNNEIWKAME